MTNIGHVLGHHQRNLNCSHAPKLRPKRSIRYTESPFRLRLLRPASVRRAASGHCGTNVGHCALAAHTGATRSGRCTNLIERNPLYAGKIMRASESPKNDFQFFGHVFSLHFSSPLWFRLCERMRCKFHADALRRMCASVCAHVCGVCWMLLPQRVFFNNFFKCGIASAK